MKRISILMFCLVLLIIANISLGGDAFPYKLKIDLKKYNAFLFYDVFNRTGENFILKYKKVKNAVFISKKGDGAGAFIFKRNNFFRVFDCFKYNDTISYMSTRSLRYEGMCDYDTLFFVNNRKIIIEKSTMSEVVRNKPVFAKSFYVFEKKEDKIEFTDYYVCFDDLNKISFKSIIDKSSSFESLEKKIIADFLIKDGLITDFKIRQYKKSNWWSLETYVNIEKGMHLFNDFIISLFFMNSGGIKEMKPLCPLCYLIICFDEMC